MATRLATTKFHLANSAVLLDSHRTQILSTLFGKSTIVARDPPSDVLAKPPKRIVSAETNHYNGLISPLVFILQLLNANKF